MPAALYLVATPIGNLEDITMRALRILREVDLIACEDTRHTRKLLTHYNISTPTTSYHEHNEKEKAIELAGQLQQGRSIALVSDAGMPAISDPGYRLVREAIDRGIAVIPVPGPTAFVAALAASGLPTDSFLFAGFLPAKRGARRARLEELKGLPSTIIFYEAPHRLKAMLEDLQQVIGDRQAVVARELTKIYEQFLRGSISQLLAKLSTEPARGEMVVLVSGKEAQEQIGSEQALSTIESISQEVERLMREQNLDRMAAIKAVARSRRLSKSEVYKQTLKNR